MHTDFVVFLKVIDGALNVASVAAQDLSEADYRQAAQAVSIVCAKVDDFQNSEPAICPRGASAHTHGVDELPFHERAEARHPCRLAISPWPRVSSSRIFSTN